MLTPYRSLAVLGCAGLLALAGCGTPGGTAAAPGAATRNSPAALLAEVDRELAAMRSTRYQHHTVVNEARGSFHYDCSGLVDYALGRAAPDDLQALPVSTSTRPLAADIERRLQAAGTGTPGPWRAVPDVTSLRPGDLIAWLATEDSTTGDTGHVMVVLEPARPNPDRAGEWLVRVADSTLSPHARDSRTRPTTGLGTGTIGLVTDGAGHPTGFYWRGGLTRHPEPTTIALGRPSG
jgi:hypothetical protein